jgi:riboflavin kinase / FMN adenylyltransferase
MPKAARIIDPFERLELPAGQSLHLAIGMFDGVHLGHQAVIESAVKNARRRNAGVTGVLTFNPHPSEILRPDNPTPLILSRPVKNRLLSGLGVDYVLWQPFTKAFAEVEAEAFATRLMQALPNLRSLHVGDNFRFGKGRRGDTTLLLELARQHDIHLFAVERHSFDGQPISSSRIRDLLRQGHIRTVNSLLGYSYFSHGKVIPGARIGRSLGFPTLNIAWRPVCRPRYGVYALKVFLGPENDGEDNSLAAVANYGVRPTVGANDEPLLEIHILDSLPFEVEQGADIRAEWHHFIRPEQRFENLEALKTQIARDKESARQLLDR